MAFLVARAHLKDVFLFQQIWANRCSPFGEHSLGFAHQHVSPKHATCPSIGLRVHIPRSRPALPSHGYTRYPAEPSYLGTPASNHQSCIAPFRHLSASFYKLTG